MKKLHLVILKAEVDDEHMHRWISACQLRKERVSYSIVELTRSDWLEKISAEQPDGLLAIPPNLTMSFKQLYDERVRVLSEVLQIPVYPSLPEIMVYENKRYLSYWLKANQIPHPQTWVFYHENEALEFLGKRTFPIVGKTNIGASGHGVNILKNLATARQYVHNIFSGKGAGGMKGPNWKKGGFFKRAIKGLKNWDKVKAKLANYKQLRSEVQKNFVLFQEFIPHDYEWRVVRIGDNYFAHKKIVKGEKASGSLIKEYGAPPLSLMDFAKTITDKHDFRSQAVDIFETSNGQFLINEMQCTFGQSDPYQMVINGEPGRYRHINGTWVFEAGDYCQYECFLMRLDDFIEQLSVNRKAKVMYGLA